MEAIGIISLTLLMGWLALGCLAIMMMSFGGFDEQNIPVGVVVTIALLIDLFLWWIWIGSKIHLGWG